MRPKQTIGKRLLKKARVIKIRQLIERHLAKEKVRKILRESAEAVKAMNELRSEYHKHWRDFRTDIPVPSPSSLFHPGLPPD